MGEGYPIGMPGGLGGTVTMPELSKADIPVPINCILDTICMSVGYPNFTPTPAQTIHAFAMLATADGSSRQFTLHPEVRAEVVFVPEEPYPAGVITARATGLGYMLTAETRCMMVCGHYITGEVGATTYTFTYSGTLLFR